jgi:serine/threonine-protein kinase
MPRVAHAAHRDDPGTAPFPPLDSTPRRDARSLLPFGIGLGALALFAIVLALLASGNQNGGPQQKPSAGKQGSQAGTRSEAQTSPTVTTTTTAAPGPPAAAALPQPRSKSDPAKGAELNNEGYSLIGEGKYDEAVKKLQEAVSYFPPGTSDLNYAYALYNLGHALRLAGRPAEAIPVLEQRAQIPDQLSTVQHELDLARQEAASVPADEGGD